jgi:DNA-binding beta-propeller fold protein YncE
MHLGVTLPGACTFGLALVCLAGCPTGTSPPSQPPQPAAFYVGARPLGVVAAGGNVYSACEGGGALAVYGIDAGKLVKNLALAGGTPGALKTFLDRRQVLVQDTDNGVLEVLDAGSAVNLPGQHFATPPPVATQLLHTLPIGKGAARIALGDDNASVLSSAGKDDKVILFAFADDRTIAPKRTEFPIGPAATDGRARPIDLKGGQILTADLATRQISTIQTDTAQSKVLTTVGGVGPLAFGMVDGKAAYALVTDTAKDTLVIVDLANGQATTVGDLGKGIADMVIDQNITRAYLAMHDSNELAVVDYVTKTLVKRLAVGQKPSTVTLAAPVPNEVWVAGEGGTLSVIDGKAANPAVKATLPLGQGDHRLTFWSTKGFASNQTDGTLSIIDREAIL